MLTSRHVGKPLDVVAEDGTVITGEQVSSALGDRKEEDGSDEPAAL